MKTAGAFIFGQPRRAAWLLGLVGVFVLLAPWSLYDKLWGVAYGICPQRPGHSLFHGGIQMPIEARESGIFGGFVIGLVTIMLLRRFRAMEYSQMTMLAAFIGFIGIMGLDGLNAIAYDFYLPTPYVPQVNLRLGTGLLAGLGIAGVMLPTFNQIIWRSGPDEAPLTGWRDLGVALLFTTLFFLAANSEVSWLLFPVSIIVIGGQLLLMSVLGGVLAVSFFGYAGRAERWIDLAPVFLLGLVLAALALGASSTLRYFVFGPGPMPSLR